jgi:hypothetical protein
VANQLEINEMLRRRSARESTPSRLRVDGLATSVQRPFNGRSTNVPEWEEVLARARVEVARLLSLPETDPWAASRMSRLDRAEQVATNAGACCSAESRT